MTWLVLCVLLLAAFLVWCHYREKKTIVTFAQHVDIEPGDVMLINGEPFIVRKVSGTTLTIRRRSWYWWLR